MFPLVQLNTRFSVRKKSEKPALCDEEDIKVYKCFFTTGHKRKLLRLKELTGNNVVI